MKIAILLRRFIMTGGAERYAVEMAWRLARKHEVHVFAQEWDQELAGITFHRVSKPFKKPRYVNQWWFSWRTARMTRGFDLIYTHERVTQFHVMHIHIGTFIGGLSDPSRLTKKRSRYQRWLKILTDPSIWAYWWLEKIHFRFKPPRHWIAVSELTRSEVRRYYHLPDACFTIAYPGVDQPGVNVVEKRAALRRQLDLKDDEVVVLFVGSEFRRKGLDALIAALGRLKNHGLKLVVVGGGDPAPYQKRVKDLGISKNIVWTGLVKNTSDYYAASDMFVLPTLSDVGPMAPMEAMAHGCPAIFSCATYAGVAEVIKNGEAILLQDPKDPAEIASAIQSLLNPDIRNSYAHKGRNLAQELSWDRTFKIVGDVLETVARKIQQDKMKKASRNPARIPLA